MSWTIISTITGKVGESYRNWATAHFLPFMVGLRTVLALVGTSYSMLMRHNECIRRLKVPCKSNLPPG